MRLLRPAAMAAVAMWAAAVCAEIPPGLKPYIKEDASVLVLNHVRVIDGTGAPPVEDQRVDIEAGRIVRIQSARLRNAYPPGSKVLDLTGKTVIPGLVGMHEHLFYTTPDRVGDRLPSYGEMTDSAPRLYLAGGVTTARTAGSLEPYSDLSLKALIDAGKKPGPKLRITGPYIGDAMGLVPQLHTLSGPEDAARTVDYWAEDIENVDTVFKDGLGYDPEKLMQSVQGVVGLR
jgi:imidazolonepropionase-like amidohydrolase